LYQRPDDTPEVARKRIDVYFEQTQPLIDYYRARGQLKEIDGEGSIEEVWSRIVKALGTQSLSMGSRSP
jgi:adenylate kinase